MSTTLTQTNSAAFPDRNPAGRGLEATFSPGLDGAYLLLDSLGLSGSSHCRFVLNPGTATGGAVRIAGALDAGGEGVWHLDYNPADRRLTLEAPQASAITTALPAESDWHAIEVGHDPAADTITLWFNGQLSAAATLPDDATDATRFWMGGLFKEHDLVGQLFMDEWIVATQYVGPVAVPPTSEHADDPARWLVIHNAADADSRAWALSYATTRHIPHANRLGLDLPTDETIDLPTYLAMLGEIEDYLDRNHLRPHILGLLLGHRVPGYVDNGAVAQVHPAGSLLHTAGTSLLPDYNPVGDLDQIERPTADNLAGVRLTARLDGPTLNDTLALTTRAQEIAAQTLPSTDQLWVDPIPHTPLLGPFSQRLMDWVASLDRQRLRLPLQVSGDPVTHPDADFTTITDDAFYWGWATPTPPESPPSSFFASPGGSRVVCVQLRQPDVEADTLRSATPSNWIDVAIAGGYAAAIASSQSTSASALPRAAYFFEALRRGWTLAEAWIVAQPFVRGGMYLVGDPLLTVRTPRAGWDVFGPLLRAEDLDPENPAAALPIETTRLALPVELRPHEGDSARYLVRRRDTHGRADASFSPLTLATHGAGPAAPPPDPAWPRYEHWALPSRAGHAVAHLILPANDPTRSLRIVELIDDRGGEPLAVSFSKHDPFIQQPVALSDTSTRYRWRLTSADGAATLTPWSAPQRLTDADLLPLTPLEI